MTKGTVAVAARNPLLMSRVRFPIEFPLGILTLPFFFDRFWWMNGCLARLDREMARTPKPALAGWAEARIPLRKGVSTEQLSTTIGEIGDPPIQIIRGLTNKV
jgi:hypothetical protein